MKLRSFVPLLAMLAAAAACESSPVLSADPALTGTWVSNEETIQSPFPAGTKTVKSRITVVFTPTRTFNRTQVSLDPANPSSIIELIEQGTFSTSNGKVRLHVRRAYYRAAAAPTPDPTLQDVDGDADYTYAIDGQKLTLVPVCPPNALCIAPRFTSYDRVLLD